MIKTPILAITAGGAGGNGKSTLAALFADYLETKKIKRAYIDCDNENSGTAKSFSHWLEGEVDSIDLRIPEDRDRLLISSAESGADVVLADLPANSTGDLSQFLEIATADTIRELKLKIVAICLVVPGYGGAESAVNWIKTLGDRADYLIVLNRIGYEPSPRSSAELFSNWFEDALPRLVPNLVPESSIHVIEMRHLERLAMQPMMEMKMLPSKAMAGLNALNRTRLARWRDHLHGQLAATGLF
jgi:MinD-like ATPase involved in chromosome partitioning or flagellar assembly